MKKIEFKTAMLVTCIFEIIWATFIYFFADIFGAPEYYFNYGYSYPTELWFLLFIIAVFGGIIPFCFTGIVKEKR